MREEQERNRLRNWVTDMGRKQQGPDTKYMGKAKEKKKKKSKDADEDTRLQVKSTGMKLIQKGKGRSF